MLTREQRRLRRQSMIELLFIVALFISMTIYIRNASERLINRHYSPIVKETIISVGMPKLAVDGDGRLPGDDIPALTYFEVEDTYENERIEQTLLSRSHVISNCTVTYYCCEQYPHICNAGPPYTCADGSKPVPNASCAVPTYIPLGSTIIVDFGDGELQYYNATDRGGAINGSHIDICVATHEEALQLGRKTATVYWCEEG